MLQFHFESVLVHFFSKATPELTVNSHCCTYYLMCFHSTCVYHNKICFTFNLLRL